MEQLLFYHYRNFQRKQLSKLGKKWKRIPGTIIVLFVAVFASMVVGIGSLFLATNRWISVNAVVCEMVFALVFHWSIENYSITNSQKQMDRYWEYCTKLKNVLSEANVHTKEDIVEMMGRLEKKIQEIKADRQAGNAVLMKLGEIIAIPVILAIITTSIEKMTKTEEMIEFVTNLLLAAGILFATIFAAYELFRFPIKHKMEQMIEFYEDLQGVLDLERFGTDLNNEESAEK
jgi:hypothetical protein